MPKVKLQAGAEFDLLSKSELDQSLKAQSDAEWVSRGAGIKRLRNISRPDAALTSSAGYVLNWTPNQGYVWNIRYIAGSLSAAQTQQFYLGTDTSTGTTSVTTLAPLANCVSAVVGGAGFGAGQIMMDPEDYIVFWAGGSATLQAVFVSVWEVPAELAWKLE